MTWAKGSNMNAAERWAAKNNAARPALRDMCEVVPKKDMNIMLYHLLRAGCNYPNEESVREILLEIFKKFKVDVGENSKSCWKDEKGNLFVDLRTDLEKHKTLFSCHMDIVTGDPITITPLKTLPDTPGHDSDMIYGSIKTPLLTLYNDSGTEVNLQKLMKKHKMVNYKIVYYEKEKNDKGHFKVEVSERYESTIKRDPVNLWGTIGGYKYTASVLGADDKVGCYILCRMIEQKIPGLYVFHVGEERGAHGSRHIEANNKDLLKQFNKAIAFDRAGYTDVIAHQRGGRCASIDCTVEVAKRLNVTMPPHSKFKGDIHGVFTDTEVYRDIIPECMNLSVGYFDQHGSNEHLDLIWLEKMFIPAVLKMEWDTLPIDRDPTKKPIVTTYERHDDYSYSSYYGAGNHSRTYHRNNVVAIDKVTKNTMHYQVPLWKPADGILEAATDEGMKRIIKSWIFDINTSDQDRAASELWAVFKGMEDLSAHYVALRKFLVKSGINIEAIDLLIADTDDGKDPNGEFENAVIEEVTPEVVLEKKAGACSKCNKDVCMCMPVRKDFNSDEEYEYAFQIYWNTFGADTSPGLIPKRTDYTDEASFQGALANYRSKVEARASTLLGHENINDPEVKAKLEK